MADFIGFVHSTKIRRRRHGLADKRLVPKDSYGLFASLASPVEIRRPTGDVCVKY